MPYHPNIPQSTDDPSQSQQDLLDNFTAIQNQFLVNHVQLTAGGQQGYHTQVWFKSPLGSNPGLTPPQTSVYTKNVAGTPELFFQNGTLSANAFQLTNLVVTTVGTRYGFVSPWGLTFNMGLATTSPINFSVPFTGTVYTALLCNSGVSTTVPRVVTVTTTQLTYSPAGSVYYLVVAKT